MDAFFASVEQLDDPTIRGKPVLVGGHSRRGVVAAASYEARKFGVHSAMPMHEALRRCPQAVVVTPHRERYEQVSREVFGIFRRFTPLVEGLSVDEAFLDVTASQSLFGDGEIIARTIKDAIRAETQLTASAGVATCKFAAKIASDLKKPDGLVVLGDDLAGFLAPLPIERMWGIGPKTAPRLRELGFQTLGDLARAEPERLERLLGSWGLHVHALARGQDDRAVDPNGEAKSIGSEATYEQDLRDQEAIARALLDHAEQVARRLVAEGLFARTVVAKLKYADFTLVSRRVTLPEPVADTASIHRAARDLLPKFPSVSRGVRLVGVSVSELISEPPLTLFPDVEAQKRHDLEQVLLRVSQRFKGGGVTRADLLEGAVRVPSVKTRR